MPQGRIILKAISQSKKLSRLHTHGARILYSWLIPHLEINGCYYGEASMVKALIMTRLKDTEEQVEEYLQDLERVNLIVRYHANDDIFLWVPDFISKQPKLNPLREGKPTIPLPTEAQIKNNSGVTAELLQSYSYLMQTTHRIRIHTNIQKVWNAQEIIRLPNLTDDVEFEIDRILSKGNELRAIFGAITNYARVLREQQYYFNHRWTLQGFLANGFENFQDWNTCSKKYQRKKVDSDRTKTQKETPEEVEPIPEKLTDEQVQYNLKQAAETIRMLSKGKKPQTQTKK
jgi:hypothetical protein